MSAPASALPPVEARREPPAIFTWRALTIFVTASAVLGEGLSFPYDFGFVPSTLGEDGDPLDVLLFLDHAVPPGYSVVLPAWPVAEAGNAGTASGGRAQGHSAGGAARAGRQRWGRRDGQECQTA